MYSNKIKNVILVCVLIASFARADIIHDDKLKHVAVGGIIYFGCIFARNSLDADIEEKWCLLLPLVAAVGKEVYDHHRYGGFDLEDIGATIFIPSTSFIIYEW